MGGACLNTHRIEMQRRLPIEALTAQETSKSGYKTDNTHKREQYHVLYSRNYNRKSPD
jgi:hypothetical protein